MSCDSIENAIVIIGATSRITIHIGLMMGEWAKSEFNLQI